MMPLTNRIETHMYETRRNVKGQNADERKISTTSEAGWANFTHQYEKVQNDQYDSQWNYIGATTYDGRGNLNRNSGTTIDEPLLH